MSLVKWGHRISFLKDPPALSHVPVRQKSYSKGSERFLFLDQAIDQMIKKQAVEEVQDRSPGFYSRMFVVPKITGGWRPIIDLSPFNKTVKIDQFQVGDAEIRP